MFTAKLISLYKDRLNTARFLIVLAVLLLVPIALILMQPNLSTTILLALILFTIIFCAGLSYRIMGIALLCIVPVTIILGIYISNPNQKLLKDYQRNRIMTSLNLKIMKMVLTSRNIPYRQSVRVSFPVKDLTMMILLP